MWGDTEAVYAGLSPMDADTCGDETSMHLEGPQLLVNIAHIGKVNEGARNHSNSHMKIKNPLSLEPLIG
jgi:hypothetical protein